MRSFALALVLPCSLLIAACGLLDTEDDPPMENDQPSLPHVVGSPLTDSSLIVGTWRWIGARGGVMGQTITPDSPGYAERRLRFGSDKTFSLHQADTLILSGTYVLHFQDEKTILHYESESEHPPLIQQVEVAGRDTLVLIDECIDCFRSLYHRLEYGGTLYVGRGCGTPGMEQFVGGSWRPVELSIVCAMDVSPPLPLHSGQAYPVRFPPQLLQAADLRPGTYRLTLFIATSQDGGAFKATSNRFEIVEK